jgi:hypothetical protein
MHVRVWPPAVIQTAASRRNRRIELQKKAIEGNSTPQTVCYPSVMWRKPVPSGRFDLPTCGLGNRRRILPTVRGPVRIPEPGLMTRHYENDHFTSVPSLSTNCRSPKSSSRIASSIFERSPTTTQVIPSGLTTLFAASVRSSTVKASTLSGYFAK